MTVSSSRPWTLLGSTCLKKISLHWPYVEAAEVAAVVVAAASSGVGKRRRLAAAAA
jgi:hypothetical protein